MKLRKIKFKQRLGGKANIVVSIVEYCLGRWWRWRKCQWCSPSLWQSSIAKLIEMGRDRAVCSHLWGSCAAYSIGDESSKWSGNIGLSDQRGTPERAKTRLDVFEAHGIRDCFVWQHFLLQSALRIWKRSGWVFHQSINTRVQRHDHSSHCRIRGFQRGLSFKQLRRHKDFFSDSTQLTKEPREWKWEQLFSCF